MSDWKAVNPVAGTNILTNPSFETGTTGWTTAGTNVIAQSTTYTRFGPNSLKCTYGNSTHLAVLTGFTLPVASVTYLFSAWIYITDDWDADEIDVTHRLFTGAVTVSKFSPITKGIWQRGYTLFTIGADVVGELEINADMSAGAPTAGNIYVDGVQCVQTSNLETYIDGDQPGCYWLGVPHASQSQRVAGSRAGGEILDIEDDLHFDVGDVLGGGLGPLKLSTDSYAVLPGGRLNNIKEDSRPFSLGGVFRGTSDTNLHANMQEFVDWAAFDAVPKDKDGYQPLRIRYQGATVEKELAVHYDRGLEGRRSAKKDPCFWQRAVLRFLAPHPHWYGIGESCAHLDTNDSLTVYDIVGRRFNTGQWSALNVDGLTGTAGVFAMVWGPDNMLYAGGAFTTIDGVPNTSRIAVYDPAAGTWAPLNNGATDGIIRALCFDADGNLYAGGDFTSMDNGGGAVANTGYIAMWDGTNWQALGTGGTARVRALAIDKSGNLYAGGDAFAMGGVANTTRIAMWDGAAWNKVSTGAYPGVDDGAVHSIAVAINNDVYIGGTFSAVDNGTTANKTAKWDGSAWTALGSGMDDNVYAMALDCSGALYAGGTFSTADGNTTSKIARWNGTTWEALTSEAITGIIYGLKVGPDNLVYATGTLTDIGNLALTDRMAKWNGASWAHLDIELPGVSVIYCIEIGDKDPIVPTNYDIFVGFEQTGTAYCSGDTTVVNDGTAPAYPKFIVGRDGGTSAIVYMLRNETTGKELLLNYALLDGETLTIDLTPTEKTITSSLYGPRMDAVLANSDFGSFSLLPGDNNITCLVNVAGDPTIICYLLWKDTYKSYD